MEDWKLQLDEWKNELLRPKSNDLLIQLSDTSKKIISLSDFNPENKVHKIQLSSIVNQLLKEQQNYSKHFGVNSLCVAHFALKWHLDEQHFLSPIYLYPSNFKLDNIKNELIIEPDEAAILNPFLEKLLQTKKQLSLLALIESSELPAGWEIQATAWLGNFHYHRHTILKDIDFYSSNSSSINSTIGAFFLGTPLEDTNEKIEVTPQLFPWDEDQKTILNHLSEGKSAKVIGPPGTGKSQLIANAVFQHALAGKWVVVSSEKEVAMQVILDKMTDKNLGDTCLLVNNTVKDRTQFIRSLQNSWEKLEQFQAISNADEVMYLNHFQAFENKLARLSQLPDTTFIEQLNEENKSIETPDLSEWKAVKSRFELLNKHYFEWREKALSNSALKYIKSTVFSTKINLNQLKTELKQVLSEWQKLETSFIDVLDLKSLADLKKLNRLAIHAQLLQQDLFFQHPDLFEVDSKKQKQYQRLAKQFLANEEALKTIQNSTKNLQKPIWSVEELKEIQQIIQSSSTWSISYQKSKSKLVKTLNLSTFSKEIGQTQIENQLKWHQLIQENTELKQGLIAMGIRHPLTDIGLIDNLLIQFKQLEKGLIDTLKTYTPATTKKIAEKGNIIVQSLHFLERHFQIDELIEIEAVIAQILLDLDFFIPNTEELHQLSREFPAVFRFVQNSASFKAIPANIALGNMRKFQFLQPDLFNYTGEDFQKEIQLLIAQRNRLMDVSPNQLYEKQSKKFNAYHQLLSAPARTLNEEDKLFKKALRNGRSILIKEFNKKKQHIPIRQLLETDAVHWIRLLKPIWMIHPLCISDILPNQEKMIDLLIMDEASQIPFVHSLPAIYRSSQLCVVGDAMQMAPTSYFTAGSSEQEDVLSRLGFHVDSFMLHYHYRSQHPDLIGFSDAYFYNNELNIFAATTTEKDLGLHFHPVKNGVYIERQNENEANALLNWLNENQNNFAKKDNFIIATFSEQQQNCIQQKIENAFPQLEKLLSKGIITLKTLENIQGEECDNLLISFGYGKNETGEFLHHFGPINQNGGDKRLNVLFSRARKNVHLFSSVRQIDFKLSDNQGVDLLRKYHGIMEGIIPLSTKQHTILDKWKLDYATKNNQISIKQPHLSNLSAIQWMTLFEVMEQRGWKLSFLFDKDRFVALF